jgi:hypothetical protein
VEHDFRIDVDSGVAPDLLLVATLDELPRDEGVVCAPEGRIRP